MTPRLRIAAAIIVVALPIAPATRAGDPTPEAREVLGKIVTDPRMKDVKQFADALPPTATLKRDLLGKQRLPDLNYIYDWSLSNDGKWPVERINDIIFEIVLSRRYNEALFLEALEKGAPFLRRLRDTNCLDRFNGRHHLSIPQRGGLSFKDAETFLYSVVGAEEFNADRTLSELCQGTTAPPAAQPAATKAAVAAGPVAGDDAPRFQPFTIVLAGGLVPLALIVLLIRRVVRERKGG